MVSKRENRNVYKRDAGCKFCMQMRPISAAAVLPRLALIRRPSNGHLANTRGIAGCEDADKTTALN